jgi:hypothetical protein
MKWNHRNNVVEVVEAVDQPAAQLRRMVHGADWAKIGIDELKSIPQFVRGNSTRTGTKKCQEFEVDAGADKNTT